MKELHEATDMWRRSHSEDDYAKLVDTDAGARKFASSLADPSKVTWNYSKAWNAGLREASKTYLDVIKTNGMYPKTPQDAITTQYLWWKMTDIPGDKMSTEEIENLLIGLIHRFNGFGSIYKMNLDDVIEACCTGNNVENVVNDLLLKAQDRSGNIMPPFVYWSETFFDRQYLFQHVRGHKCNNTADFSKGVALVREYLRPVCDLFYCIIVLFISIIVKNVTAKAVCLKFLSAAGLHTEAVKECLRELSAKSSFKSSIAEIIKKINF